MTLPNLGERVKVEIPGFGAPVEGEVVRRFDTAIIVDVGKGDTIYVPCEAWETYKGVILPARPGAVEGGGYL